MQTSTLKQSITRKLLLLVLPVLLLVGFSAPSARADDHHRGHAYRHGYRQGFRNGYYGSRGYRHGYYSHRHEGYWRYYHGRRYWYEDGGYFLSPGGISINIGL